MLPKKFLPIYIKNSHLVRIGSVYDGGYVLPKILLKKTNLLISLGIGDNWEFEKQFSRCSKCKIEAYDHSIDNDYWFKKFKTDIINFFSLKYFKPQKLYKIIQFIDFYIFFKINNKNKFYLKKVGNRKKCISFKKIMSNNSKKQIFLKSDIEGAEYSFLKEVINYHDKINGFIFEFHHVVKNLKKVLNFIKKINKYYSLVHIHANNFSSVSKKNIPNTLEFTFVHKKFFKFKRKKNNKKYPIEGLDNPNLKRAKDINLYFN
jgi:hypothetical protein